MAARPTPYSIALCALVLLSAQESSPLCESSYDSSKVSQFLQKAVLTANGGAVGRPVSSLLNELESFVGGSITQSFYSWLKVAASSIDTLMDLMTTCHGANIASADSVSTNAVFLRSVCLGFDELLFESVSLLWEAFQKEVETAFDVQVQRSEWPLSAAQVDEALQEVIRNPQSSAMDVEDILEQNPELPSAHFVRFLSALQEGEREVAVDTLHQYLDHSLVNGGSDILQFAAILSAAMHNHFGERALSLAATEEAVRIAQQGQDAVCVAFALGSLSLNSNNQVESAELIHRCGQRAREADLTTLAAGAHLTRSRMSLQMANPVSAWSYMSETITEEVNSDAASSSDLPTNIKHFLSSHEASTVVARQRLVAGGILEALGHTAMSAQTSKMVLSDDPDYLPKEYAEAAVSNVARSSLYGFKSRGTSLEGIVSTARAGSECIYEDALQKLGYLSEGRSPQMSSSFISSALILLHEWAVRKQDLVEAERIGLMLESLACPRMANYEDMLLDLAAQKAFHLARQNRWKDAKSILVHMIEKCKAEGRVIRHARFLFQLSSLILESSTQGFIGTLPALLECLMITDASKMDGLHAAALSLLAEVQLRMGDPNRAMAICRSALPVILQHEHVSFQAEAYLTLAKCHLKQSVDTNIPHLEMAVEDLLKSEQLFNRCDDKLRLKEVCYLLARTYHLLPGREELRNDASSRFVNVSRQINASGQPRLHNLDIASRLGESMSISA